MLNHSSFYKAIYLFCFLIISHASLVSASESGIQTSFPALIPSSETLPRPTSDEIRKAFNELTDQKLNQILIKEQLYQGESLSL